MGEQKKGKRAAFILTYKYIPFFTIDYNRHRIYNKGVRFLCPVKNPQDYDDQKLIQVHCIGVSKTMVAL